MSVKIQQGSPEADEIDKKLRAWRQGDVALDVDWFVHVANANSLLTDIDLEGDNIGAVTTEAIGVAVVSQTCDIVRSCLKRPFVQVARLVSMTDEQIHEVRRLERPQFALIQSIADKNFVADLDQIMTIEKSILVNWQRLDGCTNDRERRHLADALARHKSRPALPDEFADAISNLAKRLRNQRGKNTQEGSAIEALNQIRVTAQPDWYAPDIQLHFWFVLKDNAATGIEWGVIIESWLFHLKKTGSFKEYSGMAVELANMTAEDYVNSDAWDLERLSPKI